jgi:hypothetical protein
MESASGSLISRHDERDGARALALRRWKLGHRAFHFILEEMIDRIQNCSESLKSGAYHSLSLGLEELSLLYEAATSAFKYAADFDSELYADVVRPSMMPPYLPVGFSGLLNRKHEDMRQALQLLERDLRDLLGEEWPESVRHAWQKVVSAKNENLRNHGLICSHFVPGGRSLLREHYRQQAEGNKSNDQGD